MIKNRFELIANQLRPQQTIEKVLLDNNTFAYNPYTVSTKIRPSSNLIYCSCNIANLGDLNLSMGSIIEQTRESLKHIEKALLASNSRIENVIKIQIYLVNPQDASLVDKECLNWFRNIVKPHIVFLFVKQLPGGARIAIDTLATRLK